jgi:dolichol kinase
MSGHMAGLIGAATVAGVLSGLIALSVWLGHPGPFVILTLAGLAGLGYALGRDLWEMM